MVEKSGGLRHDAMPENGEESITPSITNPLSPIAIRNWSSVENVVTVAIPRDKHNI
jgi:hypothetical protein